MEERTVEELPVMVISSDPSEPLLGGTFPNRENGKLTFEVALMAMTCGQRVRRRDWDPEEHIYLSTDSYPDGTVRKELRNHFGARLPGIATCDLVEDDWETGVAPYAAPPGAGPVYPVELRDLGTIELPLPRKEEGK